MKAGELLTIVREEFLDDISDSADGLNQDVQYSNEFVLRQIGEAQRQACYRQDLRHLFDDSTTELCTITLAEGTRSYALDARILRIDQALYGDERLTHTTLARLLEQSRDPNTRAVGEPRGFYIQGRTLLLDRAPGADEDGDTLSLAVWREPLLAAPNMQDDLEWTQDVEQLGHWVAYRGFLRPHNEAAIRKAAAEHLQLFNGAFGAPVSVQARAELLAYPDLSLCPVAVHPGAWRGYTEDFDTAP